MTEENLVGWHPRTIGRAVQNEKYTSRGVASHWLSRKY
jgi:hypothetical protein